MGKLARRNHDLVREESRPVDFLIRNRIYQSMVSRTTHLVGIPGKLTPWKLEDRERNPTFLSELKTSSRALKSKPVTVNKTKSRSFQLTIVGVRVRSSEDPSAGPNAAAAAASEDQQQPWHAHSPGTTSAPPRRHPRAAMLSSPSPSPLTKTLGVGREELRMFTRLLRIRPIYPPVSQIVAPLFNPDELCVCARALETSTAAAGSRAPGQEPGCDDEVNCFAGVAVRGHSRDSSRPGV